VRGWRVVMDAAVLSVLIAAHGVASVSEGKVDPTHVPNRQDTIGQQFQMNDVPSLSSLRDEVSLRAMDREFFRQYGELENTGGTTGEGPRPVHQARQVAPPVGYVCKTVLGSCFVDPAATDSLCYCASTEDLPGIVREE
jgi:hypothetical protein